MNFRSRIAQFLSGRYGADQLYNFLFIAQIVLLFLGAIFTVFGMISDVFTYLSFAFYVIAFGLFIWTAFRCLSRNIAKRRHENLVFLRLISKLKGRGGNRPADTATHIFRACPKCKSVLRLPRTKGKHTAKCPKCDNRFKVRVRK